MRLRDRLLSSVYRLPDGVGSAAPTVSAPAPNASPEPTAAPALPADAAPAAPAASSQPPAAASPPGPQPAGDPPSAPAAPVAAPAAVESAPKSDQEFTPSLLELGLTKPDPAQDPTATQPQADPAKAADAKDPAAPADQAPGETPPAPSQTAIEYKFTYPEGFDQNNLDGERMTTLTTVLGKSRVPMEDAQSLVDLHLSEVGRIGERVAAAGWDVFNKRINSWRDEVKSDPIVGGENIGRTMQRAQEVIRAAGLPQEAEQIVYDTFKTTGAGNRLQIVQLFDGLWQKFLKEPEAPAPVPARVPGVALTNEQRGMSRYGNTSPR